MAALADVPEVLVFSSDIPHAEGNPDPIGIYGDALASQPEPLRSAFLGGTMDEVFARTGDPLPVWRPNSLFVNWTCCLLAKLITCR